MNDMTLKNVERFDMVEEIRVIKWYLRLLTWIISFPTVWLQRSKISKEGMNGIKGSYLMLCNHNAFLDFMVATAAIFPRSANYVVAIDGFIKERSFLGMLDVYAKENSLMIDFNKTSNESSKKARL